MFDAFLNPWSMAAGVALVSAPVIIHLINRMRFKRVRWAAMEFLLKAQKRMRRKMILEQLLLLLLRCLLVLLAGLLVGRYLGLSPFGGKESRATAHVVVLDDSPSTADFWRGDDGQMTDSFRVARDLLTRQVVPAIAQASTPQSLHVLRLSDLGGKQKTFVYTRVAAETGTQVASDLNAFTPSTVRVGLAAGLKKAKDVLDAEPDKDISRVVHVLSDLRAVDWSQEGDEIHGLMQQLAAAQVQVHLVDVAHPYRRDDKKTPLFHDNIGVVDLRPKARVAAKDQPLEFVARIKNFGNTEVKDVRCAILVNGDERRGLSLFVPTLPANQEVPLTFNLTFTQTAAADKPLDRFNLVSARLELTEPGGLAVDNVRHTVVEVRDRLAVMVVEGRPQLRDDKGGDTLYLRRMLRDSFGGIDLANGSVADLEKQDLRRFTAVYLANVPALTPKAAENLEGYVRGGGGLSVFLGPDVKPAEYNKVFYRDGAGLFPVPLPDKPTDELNDEQKFTRRFGAYNKKILLRSGAVKEHPAVRGMYTDDLGKPVRDTDVESWFYTVFVDRHWPVQRLGKWRDDRSVQELFCLPNDQPVANYEGTTIELLKRLPVDEPKYEKYKKYLTKLKTDLRATAASSQPLSRLSQLLDYLLCDQINEGDESEPVLREFWALPEISDLRNDAARLRDTVKFGDPLYLAKQFGRGRVTAVMTTAGEGWNEWASGNKNSQACFVAVMAEMQKYLAGGGSEENLSVGSPFELALDPARYKATARRTLLTLDASKDKKVAPGESAVVATDLGEQPLDAAGNRLVLKYDEAVRPGAYVFQLTQLKDAAAGPTEPSERPEFVAHAFNVDAVREGDLRRANRDDLAQYADKVPVHSPDDAGWLDTLKQKRTDLSSTRWLYLIILLVLIAEQAMAVRLSYHTRPGELESLSPTAAAAVARTATLSTRRGTAEPEAANVA